MVLITKKSILDITILIAVAFYASSMAPTTAVLPRLIAQLRELYFHHVTLYSKLFKD